MKTFITILLYILIAASIYSTIMYAVSVYKARKKHNKLREFHNIMLDIKRNAEKS